MGYVHEGNNNAGRKSVDTLILFRMLVMQHLSSLCDEQLEIQVND